MSPGLGFKTGMAIVRMETPVLYFYPEKEMAVTVDVSFVNGSIAETFPHSSGGAVTFGPPYQTPMFADLGRFGVGAMDIAADMQKRRMNDTFHSLIRFGAEK